MLSSYTIENLLKAVIIKNNDIGGRNNGVLPKKIQSHNLIDLMNEANMEYLLEYGDNLLKKLGESAKWFGRYPVPIRYQDYSNFMVSFTSSDCEYIERIISEIKNVLNKE